MRRRLAVSVLTTFAIAAVLGAASAGAKATEVWTTVRHDVVYPPVFHQDDICGPRPSTETFVNTVEVGHLTAHEDGSFVFVDFETGFVVIDFLDPSIPDQTTRRTETFSVRLTPGETFTVSNTFRQADHELTVRSYYHLTTVGGVPKIERRKMLVRGCP